MRRHLHIESSDGAVLLAGVMRRGEARFLVAGRDGFALAERPTEDAVPCVLFLHHRCRIWCLALRSAVEIGSAGGLHPIRGTLQISIGVRRFAVRVSRCRPAPRNVRRALLLGLAGLVALGATAALWTQRAMSVRQDAATVAPPDPEPATRPAALAADEGARPDPLLMAREHYHAGRIAQARLELIEVLRRGKAPDRAQAMLEDLDRQDRVHPPEPQGDAQARELFEEGMRLLGTGDEARALARITSAQEIVRGMASPPPIAAAIDEAERSLRAGVQRTVDLLLQEAAAVIEAAAHKHPRDAVAMLRKALSDAEVFSAELLQMPGLDDLRTRTNKAIAAAAERWMASVQTAEQLRGCGIALSGYEEIDNALGDVLPEVAATAQRFAARCRHSR